MSQFACLTGMHMWKDFFKVILQIQHSMKNSLLAVCLNTYYISTQYYVFSCVKLATSRPGGINVVHPTLKNTYHIHTTFSDG